MVFWDKESKRQLTHLVFGICFAALVFYLSSDDAFLFLFGGAALTLLISLEIAEGRKVPLFDWLVKNTERENHHPGYGVTWYFFGVILTFTIFHLQLGVPKELIVSSMLVLAIGDSVCTGLGRKIGKRLLPRTETKSWAGSSLGFLFSFLIAPFPLVKIFSLEQAFFLAFIGALVGMAAEAYFYWLNDNLTIPLSSCAAMSLVVYALAWI